MDASIISNFLDYNSETGQFKWKIRTSNRVKVGDVAGVTTKNGYISISINGVKEYAHRLAWMVYYGETPDCIDHVNGDKTDNRISNLRNTTKGQNNKNQHVARSGNSLGVSEYKTKSGVRYRATITEDGLFKHLGSFHSVEDAAKAYMMYREERGV